MALVKKTAVRAKAREVEPDDTDEDDAPATTRAAAKPVFRTAKSKAAEPEDEEGFEDEDDRPARASAVQSGWGAAKKLKSEGGQFADEFSITNDEQLVKFMEDAPYAVYKQHWLEGLRSTKKRSFICLGKGCPICGIGEGAAKKWAFNVAVLSGETFEIKSLIAGARLFDLIDDEHTGSDGPLNEGYWSLSKSGKKQSTTYKLKKVEGRKLEALADADEEALDAELAEADLTLFTPAQHQSPTKTYLQEIADELTGEDD